MIPGITASVPFRSDTPPGPPGPVAPAPPGQIAVISPLGAVPAGGRTSLNYDPITGVWLICSSYGAGAYWLSFDRGQTWVARTFSYGTVTLYNKMYIYDGIITAWQGPGAGSNINLGFRSTDYGKTWVFTGSGSQVRFNRLSVDLETIDPLLFGSDQQMAFVATDANIDSYRLTKSANSQTWTQLDMSNSTSRRNYRTPLISSLDRSYGIASYSKYSTPSTGEILRIDVGATPTETYAVTSFPSMTTLAHDGIKWIGVSGSSYYHSSNGTSWSQTTLTGLDTSSIVYLTYGNGYWLAVCRAQGTSSSRAVYTSETGYSYTRGPDLPYEPTGFKYGGDRWMMTTNAANGVAAYVFNPL